MADFEALLDGYDATVSVLKKDIEEFELDVDHAIQMAALDAQKDAIDFVPVRTGELQSSITYMPGYLISEVFTDVYYAPFVEFGTYKMQAQPYMVPAYEFARDKLLLDLQEL